MMERQCGREKLKALKLKVSRSFLSLVEVNRESPNPAGVNALQVMKVKIVSLP